jgi:hypothetical protein
VTRGVGYRLLPFPLPFDTLQRPLFQPLYGLPAFENYCVAIKRIFINKFREAVSRYLGMT